MVTEWWEILDRLKKKNISLSVPPLETPGAPLGGTPPSLRITAVEAPLDNILGLRLRSVPLPLSDSSLGKRVMLASTRSLPEPLRSEGVFGSRSLIPHQRVAAA